MELIAIDPPEPGSPQAEVWAALRAVYFQQAGQVAMASTFRVKGNEAWKVYVTRFHRTAQPTRQTPEAELKSRTRPTWR